jgi:hypothetical protein
MIRYQLICSEKPKRQHTFEAWFSNSAAFDRQSKRGQVLCPKCRSSKVAKALMAPQVRTTKGKRAPTPAAPGTPAKSPSPEVSRPLASLPPEQRELYSLLKKVREHVVANSEYVGPRFADEARKIHHEEAPSRGIYGEATLSEAKALHEEGITALPLPDLPGDHN